MVQQQGEQWIQTMLVAGLTALLSESTHRMVQDKAEQGPHTLLQKGFAALPEGQVSPDLQTQMERTLQAILRESLDAVFAQEMQDVIAQQGQDAVRHSMHRDFGAAWTSLEHTVRAMVEALVTVLRRQWQRVLRLLLKVVLSALEGSLSRGDETA
jgi:hypothetical protein